jgi:hypothetical protein
VPPQLLFLELNEINFESVKHYCSSGHLPHLRDLIDRNGWSMTTSEQRYEHLEPWIQWVTAHTGLSLAEHGVSRLGDIVHSDLHQIWEDLEDRGLSVGAISPMNAKHRLRKPAFFVPDPWTTTTISGPRRLRNLYGAIAQAVADNAQSRITARSAWELLLGAATYARWRTYPRYLQLAASAFGRPWKKALVLDLLLADVFIGQVMRTRPDFATLFLNAGAHIQHHYMFCSHAYHGPHRNPAWYVSEEEDPVLEVYRLYDRIVGDVRRSFPSARIMIATALHQDPHGEVTFYWRLRNHAEFLSSIGVPFTHVEPRMSRDFLVVCANEFQTAEAARVLSSAQIEGRQMFEVDNRGKDLFVMLTYPKEIDPQTTFSVEGREHGALAPQVVFVALKNGEHNGYGYFLDTGLNRDDTPAEFPLKEIPSRVLAAFGFVGSASPALKVPSR